MGVLFKERARFGVKVADMGGAAVRSKVMGQGGAGVGSGNLGIVQVAGFFTGPEKQIQVHHGIHNCAAPQFGRSIERAPGLDELAPRIKAAAENCGGLQGRGLEAFIASQLVAKNESQLKEKTKIVIGLVVQLRQQTPAPIAGSGGKR